MDFYNNRSVLITGHTGFKGAWLCRVLTLAGAKVAGYALDPPTEPNLFELAGIEKEIDSTRGDIRDYDALRSVVERVRPEIVIHMAAQPLVRESYRNPRLTYETNVMGTVNVLECVRNSNSVRSFLNVTTDKVYLNDESGKVFSETDELDGYDPYSNSKSCSELVTHSYVRSFFSDRSDNNVALSMKGAGAGKIKVAVSTARAGNVIGGGDFACDRIVPDCVRAAVNNEEIIIRNPGSIRPFQHILEPLFAYLLIARCQYEDNSLAGWYNVGPDKDDCINAGAVADIFVKNWGEGIRWKTKSDNGPHEADFLHLDCTKLKKTMGWKPVWHVEKAVQKTVEWYKLWQSGMNMRENDRIRTLSSCMDDQIEEYRRGITW